MTIIKIVSFFNGHRTLDDFLASGCLLPGGVDTKHHPSQNPSKVDTEPVHRFRTVDRFFWNFEVRVARLPFATALDICKKLGYVCVHPILKFQQTHPGLI